MAAEEELLQLRLMVGRLRLSRRLLLRLLDESLQERAVLQARLEAATALSNVRQLAPRSAQDKEGRD